MFLIPSLLGAPVFKALVENTSFRIHEIGGPL